VLALAIAAMLALGWLALRHLAPLMPSVSDEATASVMRPASDGDTGVDAELARRARASSDGGSAIPIDASYPTRAQITAPAPNAGAPTLRGEAAIRASCEWQGHARCVGHTRCGCDEADLAETWAALVTAGIVAEGDVATGDCESAAISECMASVDELRALVPRLDEVTLDPTRADACMHAIQAEASACDEWRWPLDCALALTVSLDPDGTCAEGVEVCPGGMCDARRACVPEPREGAACVQGIFCAPGQVCSSGLCVARRSQAEGGPCGTSEACATDLVCAAGVCSTRGREGAECSEASCETGLTCNPRQHRCRPASERCTDDLDCGARRICAERDGRGECRPARCVMRPAGPL